MISEHEYLERVVSGIQAVSTDGANVQWNEKLNGRQFDVVVRFRLGTLRYIVLIEVRNRKRPTSASDIEAFTLKARDLLANKVVFVSRAGFQRGAIKVAESHGTDLFSISFDTTEVSWPTEGTFFVAQRPGREHVPATISFGEPRPMPRFERICLIYSDGRKGLVPTELSQMTYYLAQTTLSDGRVLFDPLEHIAAMKHRVGKVTTCKVSFDPLVTIEPPDQYFFSRGSIKAVTVSATSVVARPIRGNAMFEPGLLSSPVVYTNVLTGEVVRYETASLPLGDGEMVEGAFYFTYHPLIYFHCDKVRDDKAAVSLCRKLSERGAVPIKGRHLP